MGEQPVVSVNDCAMIVEYFQKDGEAYAGRTYFPELDAVYKRKSSDVVAENSQLLDFEPLQEAVEASSLSTVNSGEISDALLYTFFAILALERTSCKSE